jgi:hypothetical protein
MAQSIFRRKNISGSKKPFFGFDPKNSIFKRRKPKKTDNVPDTTSIREDVLPIDFTSEEREEQTRLLFLYVRYRRQIIYDNKEDRVVQVERFREGEFKHASLQELRKAVYTMEREGLLRLYVRLTHDNRPKDTDEELEFVKLEAEKLNKGKFKNISNTELMEKKDTLLSKKYK